MFVAALAAATAFAAVDALVGGPALLVDALVLAPLLAAVGGGERRTAIVGVYCVALALPLGLASDAFGSGEHVAGVLTVALAGVLAFVIARLRGARERDTVRLSLQYAVARILSDAETLEAASPRLLERIAIALDFEVAGLWRASGEGRLRCVERWHAPGVDPGEFGRLTRELELTPGRGLPGRVWESGRAAWLPNVVDDENFPRARAAATAGLHGGAAFPVRTPSRALAVIELFSRDPRAPDPDLIELMEALGAQLGEFVEALQAQAAVRESEARKRAVLESALDCVITIDHHGRVLEFNHAAELTFGYTAQEAIGSELAELIVPPDLRDRHRAGLRRYEETGEARILGRRLELTGMRADGSELPVDLAVNRVAASSPPEFTATLRDITERKRSEGEREELLRLEQLARRDATQARDQLQAILGGVADSVTAQGTDGRLLFANEAAVELLGFESREDLLAAPLATIMERFDLFDDRGGPFPIERLPGRRALERGEPEEALVRFRVRATGEERWSVVKAAPIRDAEGSVTMAINVIEDITAHKRAELEQRFLADAGGVLSASLEASETLRAIAALAVPQIADWCAVDLRSETGAIDRVALAHSDPALLEEARSLRDRYPPRAGADQGVRLVLETGKAQLIPVITDELLEAGAQDEQHLALLRRFGFRSGMIVPLRARERTLGALSFVTGRSGRRFDERDLELAEELGRRCGTAIENSRLYSERAYIAKTLQASLLPVELPEIAGIDSAARFRPTGEGNEVGGDFYDLFENAGGGWTVVVGDVCGKGPDAAAVTALARYTLRAAAMRERLPSRSLRMLNEALLRQRDDGRFCTVAYAQLEHRDGGTRVAVACGGHPLPLMLRRNGGVESLGAPGTLLGVVPEPQLVDSSDTLAPGDAIVFYTDGVTDARSGALSEGELAELLRGCAGQSADAIAAGIEAAAVEAQGGTPKDDIAVLVLLASG